MFQFGQNKRMKMQFFITFAVTLAGLLQCDGSVHNSDPGYHMYTVETGSSLLSRTGGRSQEPFFLSTGRTYQVKLGTAVTFHCEVGEIGHGDNQGTVIWKKDNRLISAGDMIIRKDPRLRLEGYNLTMQGVGVKDEGEYICEVETYTLEPIQQSNILNVLIPASVQPLPHSGQYTVREGSTMTLECEANGNPKPVITWKKEGSLLPNGHKFMEGPAVQIETVHRDDDGVYVCMADNKVGSQAVATISLTVLHAPHITLHKNLHTGRNRVKLELVCLVQAEPRPQVSWYKDTMLLDPTHHRQMISTNNRHTLTLHNLQITDFGNYSCVAANSMGRDRSSLIVSGKPEQIQVTSPREALRSSQYKLTWQTVSLIRIDEYRIMFRQSSSPTVPLRDAMNTKRRSGDGSEQRTYNGRSYNSQSVFSNHNQNGWTIISHPPKTRKTQNRFEGVIFQEEYLFRNLMPESEYEVTIEARNEEGWSEPGASFRFTTPRYDIKESFFGVSSAMKDYNRHTMTQFMLLIILLNIV